MLGLQNKNKKLPDPLSDVQKEAVRPKEKHEKKPIGKGRIIRAEELEKLVEAGTPIDEEAIISMYRPQRKARRFAAALLRLDKLRLLFLSLVLLVALLFILSFTQEKMGNFTINLNRLELYRKGISIAADRDFTTPTARLVASAIPEATNISINDIPEGLDEIDGDHNGENYMCYTYYVRNSGKMDVGYLATVTLDACAKNAEQAVRVAVWRNGEKVVYAMPSASGEPEEGCTNFESPNLVCSFPVEDFRIGYVDKYTIMIWLEGDDPECVDSIVGGSVQFSMDIQAIGTDDRSLLAKFLQDIRDTLTDDLPINAAGNDAPVFDRNITYDTRLNQ